MKRLIALLLLVALLPASALAQEPTMDSILGRWLQDQDTAVMIPYENRVFGYALEVPGSLIALDDETLASLLAQLQAEPDEDNIGMVFDLRLWFSADGANILEFQVKEPTFDSMDTEYERREETAKLQLARFAGQGYTGARLVSGDAFVETPVGDMLESVYVYTTAQGVTETQIILDLYYGPLEYCLVLIAAGDDVQAARELIASVAGTLKILI